MNQRFMFYKLTNRDTFGQHMIPPKGSGFELINKNLLHDSVDQLGNNLLKQSKRLNADLALMLEKAVDQIKFNYFAYLDRVEEIEHTAPIKELYELERVEYNR